MLLTISPQRTLKSLALNTLLLPERWRSGVAYNPLSDGMVRDPYPVYAKLRERSPVHYSRLADAVLLSRYKDVDAILRNHARFTVNPDLRKSRKARYEPPLEERSILFMDPPDHTRLRSLVNKAFTRTAINSLEPRIREIMGGLLDDIGDPAGFHSAGVSITASARLWRAWKDASLWRCCSNGSTHYVCLPTNRHSATASCCAVLQPCR